MATTPLNQGSWDDWAGALPMFAPGTRVRIAGTPSGLLLRTNLGTVVRPHNLAGYYLVRLDQPARSCEGPAGAQDLLEIIEAADNLAPVTG